jgi:hypothetical protein
LSYQLNELKSKNIAGFIEIASTTFVESASMKIGGAGLLCLSQRLNCCRVDFILKN